MPTPRSSLFAQQTQTRTPDPYERMPYMVASPNISPFWSDRHRSCGRHVSVELLCLMSHATHAFDDRVN